MQVTIEGVVRSDVLEEGEQRTVEHTPYIKGLLRSRLAKVIAWHHDEPASNSGAKPDTVQVSDAPEPLAVEDVPEDVDEGAEVVEDKPKRRRRTAAAEE
jgi:hypothetical protein